jgi:DNA-binding SARP family transcriptional activator
LASVLLKLEMLECLEITKMASTQQASLGDNTNTESHPRLLVCLLGGFRLLHEGKPLHISKKGAALLCVLARRGGSSVSREAILADLWPDNDPQLAGRSLNTLLWSLHRRLAPFLGATQSILHVNGMYSLNARGGVEADTVSFDTLADAGDAQARRGDWHKAVELYRRAAALYRGDLYAGADMDAEVIIERERLRARLHSLLADLARSAYDRSDIDGCLAAAQRVLSSDPFREDMHRLLMRCYVRCGERSQALRQYQVCKALLQNEFAVEPEPSTTELFEQIRVDPSYSPSSKAEPKLINA